MQVVYPNLRAEMGRKRVNPHKIAIKLNFPLSTLRGQLRRGDIELGLAGRIRDTFFPETTLEYLFGEIDAPDN